MGALYFLLRFVISQKFLERASLLRLNVYQYVYLSLYFVALYSILEQTAYSLKEQKNNY